MLARPASSFAQSREKSELAPVRDRETPQESPSSFEVMAEKQSSATPKPQVLHKLIRVCVSGVPFFRHPNVAECVNAQIRLCTTLNARFCRGAYTLRSKQ